MKYTTRWLGTIDYLQATKIQSDTIADIKNGHDSCIFGLEHPEVVTLGVRGKTSDILEGGSRNIIQTDRGGQATYHNPGQLVIYPVCSIKKEGFGAREWVELLLLTTQKTLEKCNIIVDSKNNGIFTKTGKIASVGLRIKGGISSHGIAVNICNSLEGFSHIVACGVQQQPMDRVINTYPISTHEFFILWCEAFQLNLKDRALTSMSAQI